MMVYDVLPAKVGMGSVDECSPSAFRHCSRRFSSTHGLPGPLVVSVRHDPSPLSFSWKVCSAGLTGELVVLADDRGTVLLLIEEEVEKREALGPPRPKVSLLTDEEIPALTGDGQAPEPITAQSWLVLGEPVMLVSKLLEEEPTDGMSLVSLCGRTLPSGVDPCSGEARSWPDVQVGGGLSGEVGGVWNRSRGGPT